MTQKNTVLVVDDDDTHRTMLKTLVGGWGYNVAEAAGHSTKVASLTRAKATGMLG